MQTFGVAGFFFQMFAIVFQVCQLFSEVRFAFQQKLVVSKKNF